MSARLRTWCLTCILFYIQLLTGNPAERFGAILESLGYARHGQEKMISGITGQEMTCDIYIGIVYYQRLRHMVSDKFQVRDLAGG
jgi:DNA-directed RNA polymerase beta subunit